MEFDTEDSIQCTQSDVQMTDLRLLHHQENFAYIISFFDVPTLPIIWFIKQ